MENKRNKGAYPEFKQFVEFIRKHSDEADDPVYGSVGSTGGKTSGGSFGTTIGRSSGDVKYKDSSMNRSSSFNTNVNVKPNTRLNSPCVLCGQVHRLFYCDQFKAMKPHDYNSSRNTNYVKTVCSTITLHRSAGNNRCVLLLDVARNTLNLFT